MNKATSRRIRQMRKDLPSAYDSMNDPDDPDSLLWEVRTELDLIRERQDGTDHYTLRDIRAIEKFCEKWSSKP